jgi:hypothetical protein
MTPATEKLYMAGFNASIDCYRELLAGVGAGALKPPNDNFDVGAATKAGSYALTDAAYAKSLHKLGRHYPEMPQELRSDILAFNRDLSLPIATNANQGDWVRLQGELDHLGAVNSDVVAASSPASSVIRVTGAR